MKVKDLMFVGPAWRNVIRFFCADFGNLFETRRSARCCLIAIGGFQLDCSISKKITLSHSYAESENKELAKLVDSCELFQMLIDELDFLNLPCGIFKDNAGATI